MGVSLRIENLEWAFEQNDAPFLTIKHFECSANSIFGLCGPSGSGKSSLLYLLSGMEKPAKGAIYWGGVDITVLSESDRTVWRRMNVGMVFQDFRLIPELDVISNVLLPSTFTQWKPKKRLQDRACELLRFMDVNKPNQMAGTLSRGEMQRTAIARALLFKPDIILADEPTASLDLLSSNRVINLLFDVAEHDGSTLIISTHDSLIKNRLDNILELDHGHPALLATNSEHSQSC